MTKAFRERILKELIVDTKNYRYVVKQNTRTWQNEILRLPIDKLDTTEALKEWEVVEVFGGDKE